MEQLELRVERIEKKLRIYKVAHLAIAVIVGSVVTASAITNSLGITSFKAAGLYHREPSEANTNSSPVTPVAEVSGARSSRENDGSEPKKMTVDAKGRTRNLSKISVNQVVQDEVVTRNLKVVDANGNVVVNVFSDADGGFFVLANNAGTPTAALYNTTQKKRVLRYI